MARILTSLQLRRYAVAALAVAIAILLKFFFVPLIHEESPFLLFFAAITVSAWYGGLESGILATVLATLASWYFFVEPEYSFAVVSPSRGLRIFLFLVEGLTVSGLSAALQRAKRRAENNAQALQQSKERFRATFEQAAVGIAHVAPDGHWLLVNQRLCDIVGYTRQELLERTFQDITYPDDLDNDLGYVHQVLANDIQTYSMEKRYIRKDGSLVWINLTVSLVREPSGEPKYFISVIEDISDRKQAEIALRRSSERLAGLHTIDRAILAAHSVAELTQTALLRIRQLVPCQQAYLVLFDFEQGTAEILAASSNSSIENREGTLIPLTDFSSEVRWQQGQTHYVEDITTLKQRPPLLADRLAKGMRSLITVSLVVEAELIGELNLFASQPAAFTQEYVDIASEVAAQVAIAIQQARLREQLQRYAAELEQRIAERTVSLQEANNELEAFAYSVSHDLRAPLRAMQGFAQALLEDYGERLEATGQEYARRIIAAASRLDTLINELLTYSRLSRSELHLQPVSLASIVTQALTELESEIQEKQAQIAVEQPLPVVISHSPTLTQVLLNLLTNAIKFVAPGVRPQIRIWAEAVAEENCQFPIPNSELIRLWVEDNGIGINPEYHQRIFLVFERLHGIEAYPGTGIGLAIARKGIERLGGRVGVESQVGQGSRFWLELPRSESEGS